MNERLNLSLPTNTMRANLCSKVGEIAVGPGQAKVRMKYNEPPIHLVFTPMT
jgi:hypothetical protein